ncbi:MAG: GTP-binding protein [Muricomes sp.]
MVSGCGGDKGRKEQNERCKLTVPVYIVTGFLWSGKTTFISEMLRSRKKKNTLVIQFEEGEKSLDKKLMKTLDCVQINWTKEELENDYDRVLEDTTKEIEMYDYQEIWVEWNGMESFSKLEHLFLQMGLMQYIHIEKVIYLADAAQTEMMLGQTGEGPISQVISSDIAFLRGEGGKQARHKLERKLKNISPSFFGSVSLV